MARHIGNPLPAPQPTGSGSGELETSREVPQGSEPPGEGFLAPLDRPASPSRVAAWTLAGCGAIAGLALFLTFGILYDQPERFKAQDAVLIVLGVGTLVSGVAGFCLAVLVLSRR